MAAPAAVLQIFVDAQTGKAETNLHRLNTGLQASERQATKTHKAAAAAATGLKYMGIAAGVAAGVFLYKSVKAGATFERQMSNLGAVTGATGKQIEKFEKQALKLGESTQYTANQVAEAQTELAKGGLVAKQILGGALPASLALAAAGQLELAEAAETTVNAMHLFGLKGKDTMDIANGLATAANRTTADVSDFAEAIKYGGVASKLAGYSFNETLTVLEALAEAGIKGSMAGTTLKDAVIELLKPSKEQAGLQKELGLEVLTSNGHLKDAAGLSVALRKAVEGKSKAERTAIFATLGGTRGLAGLNAMYEQGPKALEAFERANAKQGTAAKVAAEKMDNLQGSWEQFTGALETAEIKLYKVLKGPLRSATDWATGIVQQLANTDYGEILHEVEDFYSGLHEATMVEFAGASFSLFPETAELEATFNWIINASGNAFSAVVKGYEWTENAAHNTYSAISAGVKGAVTGWKAMETGWRAFTGAIKDGVTWISRAASNVKGFVTSIIPLKVAAGIAYLAIMTLVEGIKFAIGVVKVFMPLYQAVAKIIGSAIVAAVHVAIPVIETFLKFIGNIGSVVGDVVGLVTNLLRGHWGAAWNDAKQLVVDIWHTIIDVLKGGWTVIKAVFSGGLKVIKTTVKAGFGGIKGTLKNAADFLGNVFSGAWSKVEGIFVTGANAVISVINAVIGAINAIPGIPNIGKIGLIGSSDVVKSNTGSVSAPKGHGAKGTGYQTGGFVHAAMGALAAMVPGNSTGDKHMLALGGRPIAKVESGEGIFVGNRNAMGAAKALNDSVPRFQKGGALPGFISGGDILGGIGKVAKTAAEYSPAGLAFKAGEKVFDSAKAAIGALPSGAGIPEPFKGIGPYVVGKVGDWIKSLPSSIFGGGSGGAPGFKNGVLTGKVSWFNGGATAGGSTTSSPGVALNLKPGTEGGWDNSTTDKFMSDSNAGHPDYVMVSIKGHNAKLPITDKGPAGFTQRAIDVTEGGVKKLGFSLGAFPTDATGTAKLLAAGGPALLALAGGGAALRSDFASRGPAKLKGNPFDAKAMKGIATTGPLIDPTKGFKPRTIGRVKQKAKDIAAAFTGYIWGGGHSEGDHVTANGLDCSGAVAKLTQESGWNFPVAVSTEYGKRFTPGQKSPFTIWSNASHTFAEIEGKQWGTNTANGLGYASHTTSGFTPVHPMMAEENAKESSAHTYKENVPAEYGGVAAGKSFHHPSMPKNMEGIGKELRRSKAEVKAYGRAIGKAQAKKLPGVVQALQQNLTKLQTWIAELERERHKLRVAKAKKQFTGKLGRKLANLTGFEVPIKEAERAFNMAQETATHTVELEPEEEKGTGAYLRWINEREKPAYAVLFERAADWRNTVLSAERAAAGHWEAKGPLGGLEGGWEDKIIGIGQKVTADEKLINQTQADQRAFKKQQEKFTEEYPNAKHPLEMPKWLKKEIEEAEHAKEQIPMLGFKERELRNFLGKGREEFYPGGARVLEPAPPIPGSGNFEEQLENLQGIKWPQWHQKLNTLPTKPSISGLGGLVWDIQTQASELELKVGDTLGAAFEAVAGSFGETEGGEGGEAASAEAERTSEREKARNEWLEEELRKKSQREAVYSRQKPIIDAYASKNFAGLFAKGGSIPAGMWGIAGEAGPEPVFGPATVVSNRDARAAAGTGSLGGLHVSVTNHRDGSTSVEAALNGKQIDQVKQTIKQGNRDAGRRAKTPGARNAGRIA